MNIVDTSLWIEFFSDMSKQHKLPMADSIIYATAVLCGAELYTLNLWFADKHFENLDRVHYFSK